MGQPAAAARPLTGTDNAIYRLGPDYGIRLPRIGWAVGQIAKEAEWLPRLAPYVPTAVPEPVALGEPGCGYPYPRLVYRWIEGIDAMASPIPDWAGLAREVARSIVALRSVGTIGAPPAGRRGGLLAAVDAATRVAIERLDGQIDTRRALRVWEAALAAKPWAASPVWVHGDLLPGNVLVADGRLAGIIDWSAAGIGDPACEAMLAWAMPPAARTAYRKALDLDEDAWARGRGWALEQAAWFIPYYAETIPDAVAGARHRLDEVLGD